MFINNWRRNYTDIYQPTFIYSTEEEKEEDEENLAQSKSRLLDAWLLTTGRSFSLGAGGQQQGRQQDVQDVSSCEGKEKKRFIQIRQKYFHLSSDKYLIAFPNKAKSVMEKSRREGSLYSQDCKLSIGSGSGNPRRSFRKVAGIDGPKNIYSVSELMIKVVVAALPISSRNLDLQICSFWGTAHSLPWPKCSSSAVLR